MTACLPYFRENAEKALADRADRRYSGRFPITKAEESLHHPVEAAIVHHERKVLGKWLIELPQNVACVILHRRPWGLAPGQASVTDISS